MYEILKFLISIICIIGIIYIVIMKNKYKNDKTSLSKDSIKENIIKYFQDNDITSLEKGIKTKDLPKEIVKNPCLLMMVQDKTLNFQKGKYYLNK